MDKTNQEHAQWTMIQYSYFVSFTAQYNSWQLAVKFTTMQAQCEVSQAMTSILTAYK